MTDTERAALKRLAEKRQMDNEWLKSQGLRTSGIYVDPAAVLDLLREREETLAAWETLHKQYAADVLANGDEVSRLTSEIQELQEDIEYNRDVARERGERVE